MNELGLDAATIPLVYQYNKGDLPDALSIKQLDQDINPGGGQRFETVATTGQGVHDALRACTLKILEDIEVRSLGRQNLARHAYFAS
jgi:signal recognition particle receptor subunit beta